MKIKEAIKKLIYPNKYCSEAYVNFLRRGGAKIGEGTIFYNPMNTVVDETSLPFIEIGKNCRITAEVIILAHDYSYAVLRRNIIVCQERLELQKSVIMFLLG